MNYPIANFLTNQYASDNWIHPVNVPSKEVSMIWNEKMNMMKLAKDYDVENGHATEFYIWIDAGICSFRNETPPQIKFNLKNTDSLPKDKIVYAQVLDDNKEEIFTGSCFVIHKDLIDKMHALYYEQLVECKTTKNDDSCGMEQLIFTEIKKKHPELFYKLGDDYGENIVLLYSKYL